MDTYDLRERKIKVAMALTRIRWHLQTEQTGTTYPRQTWAMSWQQRWPVNWKTWIIEFKKTIEVYNLKIIAQRVNGPYLELAIEDKTDYRRKMELQNKNRKFEQQELIHAD